jgi:hypothetical protein
MRVRVETIAAWILPASVEADSCPPRIFIVRARPAVASMNDARATVVDGRMGNRL